MKITFQLTLILSLTLFLFSCGDEAVESDPGLVLTDSWKVKSISSYDDEACSQTSIFSYSISSGIDAINAPLSSDCENLEWFALATAGGDATFNSGDFCDGENDLDVSIYFQMTSSDTLSTEAAGNYTHTMYAKAANGKNHTKEYSTYGRYFTFGTNMVTQILAKVENDAGQLNRVVPANEGPEDERSWTYNSDGNLTMRWVDSSGNDLDGNPSCVDITYEPATDYQLRGCTDENAANYFGGDNNDFGLMANEETGNCIYDTDNASESCVMMSHDDVDGNGFYSDDEMLVYPGIVDCDGECRYAASTGWIGDGVCDGANSNRGHGEYNCEAFDWDGWDCTCAPECISTYPQGDDGTYSVDGVTPSQLGDGVCDEACNVEACGSDLGDCD